MTTLPRTTQVGRRLSCEHPSLAGHFPGQPVFPGVVLLAEAVEAAIEWAGDSDRLGASPRVESVKFLSPLRPSAGQDLPVTVVLTEVAQGIDFELLSEGRVVMRGQLRRGARP